jgi:hypothetical protein
MSYICLFFLPSQTNKSPLAARRAVAKATRRGSELMRPRPPIGRLRWRQWRSIGFLRWHAFNGGVKLPFLEANNGNRNDPPDGGI